MIVTLDGPAVAKLDHEPFGEGGDERSVVERHAPFERRERHGAVHRAGVHV
ncbi:MAG: hypothetical protein RLZZ221_2322, partial [Verrucomicrobiota bacterium]